MHRAVVTGATGYVGSNLVKKLVADHWKVAIITRKESKIYFDEDLSNEILIYSYNEDIYSIENFIKDFQPEVVYHLASVYSNENSWNEISDMVNSNIVFGLRVLEAMRSAKVKKLIYANSYWVYDSSKNYLPVNFYAATKKSFLDFIKYYSMNFGIQAISLVLFDTYGPYDRRKKIIYQIIKSSKSNDKLYLTDGEQEIELLYIDDVISAFQKSFEILDNSNIYFQEYWLHGIERKSIRELIKEYEKITTLTVKAVWGARDYLKNQIMNVPEFSDLLPGWSAKINFETGINLILEKWDEYVDD